MGCGSSKVTPSLTLHNNFDASEEMKSWLDSIAYGFGELYYDVLALQGLDSVAVLPMCDASTLAVLMPALAQKGANPLHTKLLVKALKDIADEPIWSELVMPDAVGHAGTDAENEPSYFRAAATEPLPLLRSGGVAKEAKGDTIRSTRSTGSDLVLQPFDKPEDGGGGNNAASATISPGQRSPGFQRRAGKMPTTKSSTLGNRGAAIKSMSSIMAEAGRQPQPPKRSWSVTSILSKVANKFAQMKAPPIPLRSQRATPRASPSNLSTLVVPTSLAADSSLLSSDARAEHHLATQNILPAVEGNADGSLASTLSPTSHHPLCATSNTDIALGVDKDAVFFPRPSQTHILEQTNTLASKKTILVAQYNRPSLRGPATQDGEDMKPNEYRTRTLGRKKFARSVSSTSGFNRPMPMSVMASSRSLVMGRVGDGGPAEAVFPDVFPDLDAEAKDTFAIDPSELLKRGSASSLTPGDTPPQTDTSLRRSSSRRSYRQSATSFEGRRQPTGARRMSMATTYKSYRSFIPNALLRLIGDLTLASSGKTKATSSSRCESLRGALLFSDASGFTKLTTALALRFGKGAAGKLCVVLNEFFKCIIDTVAKYGGDIMKFSGDALTIFFAESTDSHHLDADGSLKEATIRATLCAHDIHEAIGGANGFLGFADPDGDAAKDVRMFLHIGLGCGDMTSQVVGGAFSRKEFILAGPPLTQISQAEPMANGCETVASPEAWAMIRSCSKGQEMKGNQMDQSSMEPSDLVGNGFYKIISTDADVPSLCTTHPEDSHFTVPMLDEIKCFIPGACRTRIADGQDGRLAEMLRITVIFIMVKGVDLHAADKADRERAAKAGQRLMLRVQESCYRNEGSVNKMLIDDKGLLVVCAFGLPGCYHGDDPSRAVDLARDLSGNLRNVNHANGSSSGNSVGTNIAAADGFAETSIGVATGEAYCGIVGTDDRREYTVMGTVANLAARLMSVAGKDGVLIDDTTALAAADTCSFTKEEHTLKGLGTVICHRPSSDAGPEEHVDLLKKQKNSILEELSYGRTQEAQRLRRILHDLKEQRGGGLVLTGGRGCGKTILVRMLETTAKSYGLQVLKSNTKKNKAKKDAEKQKSSGGVFVPAALPKKVEAELEYHFQETLGERLKLGEDEESNHTHEVYDIWHSIVQQCVKTASAAKGVTTTGWILEILKRWKGGKLYKNASLINSCLASDKSIEPILDNPEQEKFEGDAALNDSRRRLIIGKLILAIILSFAAQMGTTMVVIHFQVGTSFHHLKNHLADQWNVLRDLARYRDGNVIICTVARLLTQAELEDIPALDEVVHLCIKQATYVQLANLHKFQRREFAAALLSKLSGHAIGITDLPEQLAMFISDRAAGNPKLIMDVLWDLISGYKDVKVIPVTRFRNDALPVEIEIGSPILQIPSDNTIKLSIAKHSLMRLPVQTKLVEWVEVEFNQMSNNVQELLKVASVYTRPFTAKMMSKVIAPRLGDKTLDEVEDYVQEVLSDLVEKDVLDDVTRGFAWARPENTRHEPEVGGDHVWQCMIDRDLGWANYEDDQNGADLNEKMDFGYFSVPRREMMFELNGRTYMIDWSRLMQRNVRSGTERPIRCVPMEQQHDFEEDDWFGTQLDPKYAFSSKLMMELVRSRLLDIERLEIEGLWSQTNDQRFNKVVQGVLSTARMKSIWQNRDIYSTL